MSDGPGCLAWLEQVCGALARDPAAATAALLEFRKEPHAMDAARYVLSQPAGAASDAAKLFVNKFF